MTLTKFSDYSLRVLIYLGLHDDRLVSVNEIGRAYRVSPHHIVKVVQVLVEQGLIATVRGRNGGLRLDKPPAEINIGRLIRRTEPGWNLVECFDADSNQCQLTALVDLRERSATRSGRSLTSSTSTASLISFLALRR